MKNPEYFDGEQFINEFEIPNVKKNAILTCKTYEKWKDIASFRLSCGNESSYSVKICEGIEETEISSLKSHIEGSFGIKGLASLSSKIEESCELKFTYRKSIEEVSEFKFKAPECGAITLCVYQLQKIFRLNFIDNSWFHRDEWNKTITFWQNKYLDTTKKIKNDPDCGCSLDPDIGYDGFLNFKLANEKLAMFLGFKNIPGGLKIPDLNWSMEGSLSTIENQEIWIERDNIPPHLLFLMRDESKKFAGIVTDVELVRKEKERVMIPDFA